MKRQVYMNQGTNVQMYAVESSNSTNVNNCATGCGGCSGSGGGGGTVIGSAVAIGGLIVKTMGDTED